MSILEIVVEIESRLSLADRDRIEHARARRHIEAMACEIRIQAFREVLAVIAGDPLEPNRMYQSQGRRSARAR